MKNYGPKSRGKYFYLSSRKAALGTRCACVRATWTWDSYRADAYCRSCLGYGIVPIPWSDVEW